MVMKKPRNIYSKEEINFFNKTLFEAGEGRTKEFNFTAVISNLGIVL